MDWEAGNPRTALRYLFTHFVFAGLASVCIIVLEVVLTRRAEGSGSWNFEALKSNYPLLLWVSIYRLYLYSEMMEYLLWFYLKFFLGQSTGLTREAYKPMCPKVEFLVMSGLYYYLQPL